MQRERLLAEKRAEIQQLGHLEVAEVKPSTRDFSQFVSTQKSGIALVPRLKRADPETGTAWPHLDFADFARVCDDAEIGAIAVRTASLFGGTIEDLRVVAHAVTAPVLCDDLCLHANQVYQARLHDADAVMLPAADLDSDLLRELAAVASSVHMAAVIEVLDEKGLRAALDLAPACVGLNCSGSDGFADIEALRLLAEHIPRQRTVLLLSEVRQIDALLTLNGMIDGAVVGDVLLDAEDPAGVMGTFLSRAG